MDEDNKTLLQVFREHNEQSRKLIGKDFVSKTVQRYETTTRYLEEFIKKEYQLSDIALNNLEANFISKFDAFLKIEKGCAQNSSITRLKNLKKIIRIALENELPDSFIQKLNAAARREKSDALIIGEVWEDASNKIAYSKRRRYFQGGELDSVMNYPLRDAILGFLNGGTAEHFAESMECIRENYPRDVFYNLMNVVGTHDTARALTLLGVTENEWKMDRNGRAHYQLPPDRLEIALRRLRMAAVIQFTMPGSPTIYNGDEAGQQGFEDPFNRRTYPWGHENQELLAFYRKLCEIRAEEQTLADGDLQFSDTTASALLRYERTSGDSRLVIVVNRGHQYAETKIDALYALDLLSGEGFAYADPDGLIVSVPPETAYILRCVNAAD